LPFGATKADLLRRREGGREGEREGGRIEGCEISEIGSLQHQVTSLPLEAAEADLEGKEAGREGGIGKEGGRQGGREGGREERTCSACHL